MKYRVEYEKPDNKIFEPEPDFVTGIKELKYLLKHGYDTNNYKVKCITKLYNDGAGENVTSKYIKEAKTL